MRVFAILRAPDGTRYELVHGDLLGRLSSAAMPLDDARVSEAHAMLSLRERELRLIALRGRLAHEGRPADEIVLRAGMRIVIARGLTIEVEAVHLPSTVLGLEGPTLVRQVLPPVASVVTDGGLHLVKGYVERAAAWIWCSGSTWRARVGDQQPHPLVPDQVLSVDGQTLRAVEVSLDAAGQRPTRAGGGIDAPLRIHANFDTVQIFREGSAVLVLGGVQARLVSELVALGGPTHWTVIAGLLWPQDPPESVRSRFDVLLSRLRRKLRGARVRTDLLHTDGSGQVELLLYPHDAVEDRT